MKKLLLLLCSSCVTAPVIPSSEPATPAMHREDEIIRDIVDETLLEGKGSKSWEKQIVVGSCFDASGKINPSASKPCPNDNGVLMSDEKAAACDSASSRIRALKGDYIVDRKIWNAEKKIYESRLLEANEQVQRNYPSWFYRYGFEIGLITGMAVGVGIVKVYEIKAGLK